MHTGPPLSGRPSRWRVMLFWTLLNFAAVGFGALLGGLWLESLRWAYLGASLLGFAALVFMLAQFSLLAPALLRATPTPAAVSAPLSRRMRSSEELVDFEYPAPAPSSDGLGAEDAKLPPLRATQPQKEALVEFELVAPAPTSLRVPAAFQAPEAVEIVSSNGWNGPESRPSAVERRSEIVSGLPLLSQILGDAPKEAPIPVSADPQGRKRGQCSACGTFLWAPAQRPIRLRCPKCGHVRTLAT